MTRMVWPERRGSVRSAGRTCTRSSLVRGLTGPAPTPPGTRTCDRPTRCQSALCQAGRSCARHRLSEVLSDLSELPKASARKRGNTYPGGALGLGGVYAGECEACPCICTKEELTVRAMQVASHMFRALAQHRVPRTLRIMRCSVRAGRTPPTTACSRCETCSLGGAAPPWRSSIPAATDGPGCGSIPSLRAAAPPLPPVYLSWEGTRSVS